LGLSVNLTETEKQIGLDNNSDRSHIINKKINVLRKIIYDAAHARVIPRWEHVVKNIDRLYVLEYAIGENLQDRANKWVFNAGLPPSE
jgi:hypothetical protein